MSESDAGDGGGDGRAVGGTETADGDGDVGGERGGAADGDGTGGRPCPMCDRPMTHRHCKYVCPEHGVVYDCADTFY